MNFNDVAILRIKWMTPNDSYIHYGYDHRACWIKL